MTTKELTTAIITHFEQYENTKDAKAMTAYLRNLHPFFGIKSPVRKEISKLFWQNQKLSIPLGKELKDLVLALWEQPQRELHYFALDLLYAQLKKLDKTWITLFEQLIMSKSWWDTVDYLAPRLVSGLFLKYPELIESYSKKWIKDKNIWLQRTAIIFQLKWKDKTRESILFENILKRASSKEFFVQKASGWALRSYTRTEPQKVVDFIINNQKKLSKLTKDQGLKWLKDKDKLDQYLDQHIQ